MTSPSTDATLIRMFFTFLVLVLLSAGGHWLGTDALRSDADAVSETTIPEEEAVQSTQARIDPTPTTVPLVAFQLVGTPPVVSIADAGHNVSTLSLNDCFNLVPTSPEFADATSVACNDEHHYQLFWRGDLGSEVTDFDLVEEAAANLCMWQFSGFVGVTPDVSEFQLWTYWPRVEFWPDDRQVSCVLALQDESSWLGSGQGAQW
ncbi:MAG: hypothetical protein WCC60_24400 [Ilumatobacteraceae bacterium]